MVQIEIEVKMVRICKPLIFIIMKKLVEICSVTLLFMGGVAFTSCDQADEPIRDANSQVVNHEIQKNTGGPMMKPGPSVASYKLIFENKTNASLVVNDIFSKGVNTTPGSTNFVHFKGTSTLSFTVPPNQTVTFYNYVTATAGYSIPEWRIQNSTIDQNQNIFQTATYTLNRYGIQIPQGVLGAKYSYWYGVYVTVTYLGAGYTFTGDVNGNGASYMGRSTFGNYDHTIICTGTGPAPNVKLIWQVLSNGDVKVMLVNYRN